ncbi:SusC/RagA family TonB-linked outer membrane protein [Carboxylicivirga marina]|uniref:TonB-dependent receptor n=1 Tax=Carboxylicivirga marina TaxID=2800988 RepID=A0ABS1HR61_9BACT|nr:SusC/RagA family TonB-linked outer membrane protein [Carboxylicivirga marina]MBK3519733.1 TonB-dependent receptor [Carboxylicivirga marina]
MKKNSPDRYVLFKSLLVMKLTVLLLLVFTINAFSSAYSQKSRVSIHLKNVSLEKALETIEKESDYKFFYHNERIDLSEHVSMELENATIEDVLSKILDSNTVDYKIIDQSIILTEPSHAHSNEAQQQTKITVTGVVRDASGEALPGVTVLEKGTTNGSITGIDGSYSITTENQDATVLFTFIGFENQEIKIAGRSSIDITLMEETTGLDEVVVVGFGTQKKSNVTGATTTVDMDDVLGNRPVTNTMQAIQGTVPGMQITVPSGEPGATTSINIRGTTSINGGSALILMDNVPVSSEDVNPQDVESITVLKDAAASSIYGARAAFGVILITTKKGGKDQPVKFNYSNTFSFGTATDIAEKESTYNFVNAMNDWGVTSYWTNQDIPTWVNFLEEYKNDKGLYPEGYATDEYGVRYPLTNTGTIDELIGQGSFSQIHNFNFSGGGKKSQYRVSLGYSDENGIMVSENDRYTKYNFATYLSTDLTDNLKASVNIAYRNSSKLTPRTNYYNAVTAKPWTPASGNHIFEDGTSVPYDAPSNLAKLQQPNEETQGNMRLLGKLEYEPFKDLILTGEYTYESKNQNNYSMDEQLDFVDANRYTLKEGNSESTFYRKSNTQRTYNASNFYAKYKKQIGDHHFNALAGINKEEFHSENFWARKAELLNADLPALSTATGTITADDSFGEWAVLGYFGRINYNYKEKYFVEANGRYDGSSKFAAREKYGFFPSFSVGWNMARENFMSNFETISHLKLRASWGEIGNQEVNGNYLSIPGMPITNANWINPDSGLRYNTVNPPRLVSQTFTWETVQTLNFGLDVKLLNNRLSTSFDVFNRKTLGMITAAVKVPDVLGTVAPPANAADLESRGWELEMSWNDRINEFKYNVGFTLFDNKAEITRFDNPAGLIRTYYEGQILGEIWGYESDRFYTVDDFVEGSLNDNLTGGTLNEGVPAFIGRNPNPGDMMYKDLNGDGEISPGSSTLSDPGDRKVIGNNKRRYQYGIFGNASYKNFDFSFILNGVGKRDLYINNNIRFPYTGEFNTMHKEQMDYWTPENTDAYFPRNYDLGGVNYGNSRITQTRYLIDGSFLRVKNITLGYTLPKSILSKLNIDKFRLYVSGENLHSFDNMPDGIDTELQAKSEGLYYPLIRSFNVGLNVTF